MRKLKDLFISVLAMAMVAVACTREDDAPLGAPSITFEQNTLEFEKAGGDQTLVLTSTRDWTATCAESWVGLSKVSGTGSTKSQQITISVDPNDGYDRSASISFVAGDKLVTRNVILRQAGSGPAPVTGIFYEVNFKTAGFADWEVKDVVKPDAISEIWKYNASYGLVATAYANPTNYASESWIYSPEIDLTVVQSAHLCFSHAANYFTNVKTDVTLWLQVEGEEGFTHQLEIPVYPTSFTYVESGDIDLQEYVGKKIRLGFRYTSSATKAGTYEIQNLRVSTDPFETVIPEIPDEGTGTGTAEDPYDVAKADAVISAGAASTDKVYVKGIISKIKEVDTNYGNATYWISDDGTESKQLEIYRGYNLNNVKFTAADQIKVGDNVVVYGVLVDFNGTHEMTQGNYIYSLNGETGDVTPDPGTPETPEGTVVYSNDFDKEVAQATYGTGKSWPYLDQFDGWKNETGSGISTVDYGFKGVSARANSASDGSYSNYKGSGSNNIFFGSNAYFIVKKITLAEGRNYVVTFGSEKYLNGGDSNFNKDEFKVYVSNDGIKWVALDYQVGSSDASGKWNINTSDTFAVGADDNSLYVYFTASVASAYRLDDVVLTAVEAEGAAVDFSAGITLEGGETPDEGGDQPGEGGDQPGEGGDEPSGTMTIAQMFNAADGSEVESNEIFVAAVTSRGYVALEDGKAVYVYHNSAPSVAVGDKATFKGTKTTYYGLPEITSPTTVKVSSGNTVPYPSAKDITAGFDSYNASEAEYITFEATVIKDGSYTNFEVAGATKNKGTLSHAPSAVFDNFKEGDKIRLTGFFNTLNTSKNLVQVIYVSSEVLSGEGGENPGEGGENPGENPGEGGEDPGENPGEGGETPDVPAGEVSVSVNGAVVTFRSAAEIVGEAITCDFNAQGWANAETVTELTLSDGTVLTFSKGTNPSNPPKFYTASKGVRLYANNTLSVAGSKKLAKVVLECDSYQGTNYVGNDTLCATEDGNTWVIDNKYAQTSGGVQLRIKTITISYAE